MKPDVARRSRTSLLVALLLGAPAILGGAGCRDTTDVAGTDAGSTSDGPNDMGQGEAAACTDLVPAVPATSGPVYHLSPSGNDNNSGLSAQTAFATLGKALQNATPGTRVLVGAGTYATTATITFSNLNGTAAEPIVITPEAGANPVFDFTGATAVGYAAFVFNSCSYFFIDGITIAHSPRGMSFNSTSYMTLTRSTIHDVQGAAMVLTGNNFVIAGNETYNTALSNMAGTSTGGWPGTVATWYVNGTTPTTHVKFLQNHIHDAWGECLIALFADDVDIIDNNIHDCWAVGVYLDHAANARVSRNRLYNTQPTKFTHMTGLSIADEPYSAYAATPETNLLIAQNNFGTGLKYNLNRWEPASWSSPGNTWSHLHIVFNVFEAAPITWTKVSGGTAPSDGVIAGNIFLGSPSISIDDAATAWSITQNDFVGGVSSQFAGNGNFSATPAFVGPTDGSTLAGFAVTNAAALAVDYRVEVPQDALCATRTQPKTTAGALGP
ncbi:MAG: hypothetical protein JWO36_6530 [Myxococcales bacterium]|nr:hypothetical protein [Myxococcales bacterium]